MQAQIINERICHELKYNKPSMASPTKATLTKEIHQFLLANVDGELMVDELVEYWLKKELWENDPNWIYEDNVTNSEEGEFDVPDLFAENEEEAEFFRRKRYMMMAEQSDCGWYYCGGWLDNGWCGSGVV